MSAHALLATADLRGWTNLLHFAGRPVLILGAATLVFTIVGWWLERREGTRALVGTWFAATLLFTIAGTWFARQDVGSLRARGALPLAWGEIRPFLAVGAITFGLAALGVRYRFHLARGRRRLPRPADVAAIVLGAVLTLAILAAGVVLLEMTTTIWR